MQLAPEKSLIFAEKLSPFIKMQLAIAEQNHDETVLRVLRAQYIASEKELSSLGDGQLKHYDANFSQYFEGVLVKGVERLYRRVILVEPVMQCIANCRFCLRKNYDPFHTSLDDLTHVARFIGCAEINKDLREVLITGGDPLLSAARLGHFLEQLANFAAQIKIVRIATRIPIQEPSRVTSKIMEVLTRTYPFRLELVTHINHSCELFPEVRLVLARIRDAVDAFYNHTVLLAGVNDTEQELESICHDLRDLGIENHYLFHCIPINGLRHLRVPLLRSIQLSSWLSSNGRIPGRAKPKFCILTDVGKVVPYEGTILKQEGRRYLLQTQFKLSERMEWNPGLQTPDSASVDNNGYLRVWYEGDP